MPLTGPNSLFIGAEGKSLFLIGRDDLFQLRPRQQNPMRLRLSQQFGGISPALGIQVQVNGFRLVAQDEAQKFTQANRRWKSHV
ncbi:MAG: hypothetical protein V9G20_13225 [Candidatus Promineifilaceae bacterium]